MEKDQFKDLLNRYASGDLSAEEGAFVQRLLDSYEGSAKEPLLSEREKEAVKARMLAKLSSHLQPKKVVRSGFSFYKWMAAAVVLLVTGVFGIYFKAHYTSGETPAVKGKYPVHEGSLHAGSNKAYLKLSDGSVVVLDSAHNGLIARQGETSITKTANGKLQYVSGTKASTVTLSFNTVSTPNGGTYQLNLPDGTKVWLNAGSSLTFPTRFDSSGRSVKLTGEAYFEVAKHTLIKNKHTYRLPFTVDAGYTEVEVLGTHFNVSVYEGEKQQTTLLEGAVLVKHGGQKARIFPGQQAVSHPGSDQLLVSKADVDDAMAWKEGLFSFDNTNLPEVMKEIARWYNASIVYKGQIPATGFTGVLPRNSDIKSVLDWLELTHAVKFSINGETITVEKNN